MLRTRDRRERRPQPAAARAITSLAASAVPKVPFCRNADAKEEDVSDDLSDKLVEMREDDVLAAVRMSRDAGAPCADIIATLQEGMRIIGAKYEAGEYFLSELIMSAEIFKRALAELGVDRSQTNDGAKATVVLGTVAGDIHDIGKNIVASVLDANGFKVIDLGVDVSAAAFAAAVRENNAQVVGLSCLLTTAFEAMETTIQNLASAGLRSRVKVYIGGGPVTPELAGQLGADGAGMSAQEAVILAQKAVGGGGA